MGTTVSVDGGNRNITIYGDGTVRAGNGDDSICIGGDGKVIVGNGNDTISVHGSSSTITAGNGNNDITTLGTGTIRVGSGNDTITLGFGSDTIFATGQASIQGVFGSASVSGGSVVFRNTADYQHIERATSGNATLIGGQYSNEFYGGSGTTVMNGGLGNDTFVGGSGNDTMNRGSGQNLFAFEGAAGGTHVISHFVSGQDQLYLEGMVFSQLKADISVLNGNTYIYLDGGKTTVELVGVTNLQATDITKHKP